MKFAHTEKAKEIDPFVAGSILLSFHNSLRFFLHYLTSNAVDDLLGFPHNPCLFVWLDQRVTTCSAVKTI